MKKITVTLTDKAEKVFNDLMYSLPKDEDGTGMCTQSQAINHSLEALSDLEAKGHFAFMDDPPQASKENNADITKVNGVFVNPSPKAVTDGEFLHNHPATEKRLIDSGFLTMDHVIVDYDDWETARKWMREQQGEGAKERYEKAVKYLTGSWKWKVTDMRHAPSTKEALRIASGYTDKQ